ncbi:MAG: methyltransferase domain-containing protein, partial [Verrucomicrobiota bacterium]
MSTDWEAHYRRGETPWDKGAPSPGLVDYLAQEPMQGRLLVPGCGLGYDVRALAPGAEEVVGIDIAPAAVDAARRFPVTRNERYEVADLFELPPALRGCFDGVWEHTCFCAIDPSRRADYVEGIVSALKPGGRFLAIFYLNPDHTHPDEGPPFGVSMADLDALFLPRFELLREWLPQHAYPGREGRE